MNIFLLFLLSSLSALMMAVYLPNIVARVERNILAQHKEIKTAAETTTPVNFRAAILLLNVAPLFYFFHSEEIELSLFIFLLAIASYIDIVRRWVPDSLLFLLSGYSVYCAASGRLGESPEDAIISALFFVIPFILINGASWIKCGVFVFAAGDIYIALSMGLWLDNASVVVVAGASILLALLYGSVLGKKNLPFIPFMLFSFLICGVI
ncbi:prepilin peptidase [Candidatus Fukatsuia symbiotica]|uniref:Prepilin peptidase n=1 Tax=Candidatus Fukatsuia symbiotica TaxID=1878942 RepID=A0A2U8I962_9GAMM|nr:prepilin peptidase [Candidatus Fukatsuia symbiotica]AWK15608.1 prepilin peptidase [Candidatus Fukatsuia symbiotica]MEA9446235.1 prepilin peptidase [Candidatus Fukatsuia symbiotica]